MKIENKYIIIIQFRFDYVLMYQNLCKYTTKTILQHYFDNSSFFEHRRKVLYVLMKSIILAKVKIEFVRIMKSKCTASLWPRSMLNVRKSDKNKE